MTNQTHVAILKPNGKYGLKRITSGNVVGNFDTLWDALEAIKQMHFANTSIGIGE